MGFQQGRLSIGFRAATLLLMTVSFVRPQVPAMPPFPQFPGFPAIPAMPKMPEMPKVPDAPQAPASPNAPQAPESPSAPSGSQQPPNGAMAPATVPPIGKYTPPPQTAEKPEGKGKGSHSGSHHSDSGSGGMSFMPLAKPPQVPAQPGKKGEGQRTKKPESEPSTSEDTFDEKPVDQVGLIKPIPKGKNPKAAGFGFSNSSSFAHSFNNSAFGNGDFSSKLKAVDDKGKVTEQHSAGNTFSAAAGSDQGDMSDAFQTLKFRNATAEMDDKQRSQGGEHSALKIKAAGTEIAASEIISDSGVSAVAPPVEDD